MRAETLDRRDEAGPALVEMRGIGLGARRNVRSARAFDHIRRPAPVWGGHAAGAGGVPPADGVAGRATGIPRPAPWTGSSAGREAKARTEGRA